MVDQRLMVDQCLINAWSTPGQQLVNAWSTAGQQPFSCCCFPSAACLAG
jgi:hypothetical protein